MHEPTIILTPCPKCDGVLYHYPGAAIRAEQETVARLLDVLHTIISIGCDYDNARTVDELKEVIDDLVEIASRAHSGESIYSKPDV